MKGRWLALLSVPLLGACEFIFDGDGLVGAGQDAGGEAGSPCVDTTSDAHNCGRCGKDCLGGACVSSVCQPGAFLTAEDGVFGVAVDDAFVYWSTSAGRIARMPVHGGDAETLADGESDPKYVTVDAKYVWWTSRGAGTVRRRALAGGNAETVVGALFQPTGIAVDPTTVYVSDQTDGGAMWAFTDGGRRSALQNLSSPADVDIDPISKVAYVANEGGGAIGSASAFGGGFSALVMYEDPAGLVFTDTAFWFTSPKSGNVLQTALTPAVGKTTIVASGTSPTGLALSPDKSTLYWTEPPAGRITRLVF